MTLIVDYDAGNLASVKRACEQVGLEAEFCADDNFLLKLVLTLMDFIVLIVFSILTPLAFSLSAIVLSEGREST